VEETGRERALKVTLANLSLALLALVPAIADAKGGGMQTRPNKDFRELIVKGERPEIAACLVAAIDYARHDTDFSAIRWDDDASDRAVMRESESNGRLTRYIRLTTQMRTRGSTLFAETWRTMEVSCEQPEDGGVRVSVKAVAG
jgi:hypothetical protein